MPRDIPGLTGPFTVDDYHRMAETGVLAWDARVELLDGLVVEMSPIGSPHAGCVNRLTRLFAIRAADVATVAVQNPTILDDRSEPQPDVMVLKYRADGYAARHPGPDDVLLLIEVAHTTLHKDREVKVPIYARTGVREVWLVDLEHDLIEIYRGPGADGYASVRTASRRDRLAPLLLPTVSLAAADILG